MTQAQFGSVSLTRIAKGALAKKVDERLAEAAQKLADYVTEGGIDLTKGAKAEVVLKITLKHVEQGIFTVKGDVSEKSPTVPLPATDRLVMGEEDGQTRLFMPLAPEITAEDDPRQMTLEMAESPNRKKEL